jgi:hypothetical protein
MRDDSEHGTTNGRSSPEPRASGTPRWVKVFGIIAVAVVVLIVVLLLVGGHGPGRHMGAGVGGAGIATGTAGAGWPVLGGAAVGQSL